MRIGQSTDIHRLCEGRKLVLAAAEAILGALALGDLGHWFPDTDPKWEGVNSQIILKEVAAMMKDKGYRIGNLDCLVMIEKPKMAPHIQQMRENFAAALECDIEKISVKATRGEGLGFVGERKGVQAQAVVLLEEVE